MNRMFFHLLCVLVFSILTSCTSDDDGNVGADELEGSSTQMDSDDSSDEDFGDLEDIDSEESSTSTTTATASGSDSFSDIEDFNDDLISNELANEDISTPKPESNSSSETMTVASSGGGGDELDLESADFQTSTVTSTETTTEVLPEVSPIVETTSSFGNKITNLEYKSFESGGTILITADKPMEYQVKEEPQFNQVIVEVADVFLPENLKLPYIAKDFGQPVATINAYQDKGATTARFVIQYKTATKPSIDIKNNTLIVSSEASDSEDEEAAPTTTASKLVTIQMDNVEIKEVINFIAEESGVNILADDKGLNGKVTVRLRDVPWEDALMSILKSHGLGYVKKGNILRIAPQKLLAEEAENYLKQINSQQNAVKTLQGKTIRFFPVNYADVDDLSKKLKPFLSQNAKVSADKASNSIIISEFASQMSRIEKILKALDIQPLQIMIEGKVIEASESFSKEIGLNWNTTTPFTQGSQSGSISNNLRFGAQLPFGLNTTINAGAYDIIGDLTATLQIAQSEQKIKILSSPRIVALNKQKAYIKQIQQYPILQTTVVGNVSNTTTTFQDVQLSLEVTPQVTFSNETLMNVKIIRDIPGPAVNGARQVNKREASTSVLVKDGQTMVLGGIYSMDDSQAENGIPWLMDIPILGYLFKSKNRTTVKNELLIFLTPRIVNPEALRQASTISQGDKSGDETLTPSDFETPDEAAPAGESGGGLEVL
ncbi:MAG: type IV pilus secretin PilQ [Bdellovibrionales bacterium]|nr:type IV pilus secretin PilQ [Bdellovibrionales bacterium]